MYRGQLLRLIPFRNSKTEFNCAADKLTYLTIFTEEVRFIGMSWTGNAMIKDAKGKKRLCNPADLAPIE